MAGLNYRPYTFDVIEAIITFRAISALLHEDDSSVCLFRCSLSCVWRQCTLVFAVSPRRQFSSVLRTERDLAVTGARVATHTLSPVHRRERVTVCARVCVREGERECVCVCVCDSRLSTNCTFLRWTNSDHISYLYHWFVHLSKIMTLTGVIKLSCTITDVLNLTCGNFCCCNFTGTLICPTY